MKLSNKYRKTLEPWVKASRTQLYAPESYNGMKFYGEGTGQHWALQTNNNAFAAYAVLAADPDTDFNELGCSREALVEDALSMMRYSLSTHKSGALSTIDDRKWGHNWISPLCIERMVHGMEAIEEFLSESDKDEWLRVLASESEWLSGQYEIQAGIGDVSNELKAHKFYFQDNLHTVDKHSPNKPENNIWSGCLLYRASLLLDDAELKRKYLDRARQFFLNGVSVPSDANSKRMYAGRPLSAWHIGANFLEPSYSLNHHGYLNVGYMMICLSNIGMLHFSLKKLGIQPPEELYLHLEELWSVIKKFIFRDGRLLRTGGATRARYTYCQEYIVPSLLMILDKLGDPDIEEVESNWLKIVEKESSHNGDGFFYSERLGELARVSPYYYTRLEADRAGTLAFGAYWRRLFKDFSGVAYSKAPGFLGEWQEPFHGSVLTRSEKRIASWTWMAGQKPTGIVVPGEHSDMAEWDRNLVGRIEGLGFRQVNRIEEHKEYAFPGGFLTFGEVFHHDTDFAGEVEPAFRLTARQKIVFAALPDDSTVIGMQYAVAGDFVWIKHIQGMMLLMPNDVMNCFKRSYYTMHDTYEVSGMPEGAEIISTESDWLNIDDIMAVYSLYGGKGIKINRPGGRMIMIDHHSHSLPNLYADEICCDISTNMQRVEKHTPLLDCGYVLQNSINHEDTGERWKSGRFRADHDLGESVRAITVTGDDGQLYSLVANFSEKEMDIQYSFPGITPSYLELLGMDSRINNSGGFFRLAIPAGEAILLKPSIST